jgi:hypothetical protein
MTKSPITLREVPRERGGGGGWREGGREREIGREGGRRESNWNPVHAFRGLAFGCGF